MFNVKNYGAVGDGVANDTAAIQSAVTAAGVNQEILFPAGTYKISGTLTLLNGQTVIGEGTATISQTASLTPVFVVNNISGVRIRRLVIVGKTTDYINNSTVYGAAAVRVMGTSSDVKVIGCTFLGMAGLGVYIGGATTNVVVKGNSMTGAGATYITSTSYNYSGGILADPGATRWSALYNEISGFSQGIVTGDNLVDVRIIGNLIHDIPGQHGLYLETMNSGTVRGNIIYNTGLAGIKVQIGSTDAIDATDVLISGNTIRNCGAQGILLDNPLSATTRFRRVIITGNTIANAFGPGIEARFAVGLRVINNIIDTVTVGAGVRVQDSSRVFVLENTINNAARQGIDIATVQDYALRNNRILDCGTSNGASTEFGISIAGASTNEGIIEGNKVTDTLGNMRYGIYFTSGDMPSHSFRNNYSSGSTDYGFRAYAALVCREWNNNQVYGTLGPTLNAPTQA